MRAVYYAICILLILLNLQLAAKAEVTSGWAFLAAEHRNFPSKKCGRYAEGSDTPFLAVLADSFGTDRACLRSFMNKSKGKPTFFQYYLGNGAGRRKRLYPYEFLHRLSPQEYNNRLCSGHRGTRNAVIKQAGKLKKRCERYAHGSATCLIGLELESQFTECAAKKITNYVRRGGWDAKQIVHNPVNIGPYQGRGVDTNMLERHHVFNKAPKNYHLGIDGACADHCGQCGISGKRVTDETISRWLRENEKRESVFFSLWCPQHQGLRRDSQLAPEPRRRIIRVDQPSFVSGNRLINASLVERPEPKPHDLKRCDAVKEFGRGNVAKESDHGGFVAVMVDFFSNARLVSPDGKKYSLRYTGTANPWLGKERHHYRNSKAWHSFPDNMVFKGKRKGKTECFKLYKSGTRHG